MRMNYRHAFHAGNHADVFKHLVLLALLEHLCRKDTPFFVLDTHAGAGEYLLQGEEALKTLEAEGGIARLFGRDDAPELVRRYLSFVRQCNPIGSLLRYPGSPLLITSLLRDNDRLVACEIQESEYRSLKALFKSDRRVAVHQRDGYEAAQALLPPKDAQQRTLRGLVLIDPPYESQEDEFDTALACLKPCLQRWPIGQFALWYPIKQSRSLRPFLRKAANLDVRSVLDVHLLVRTDDSPLRLNGSGMLLINPPFGLDETLRTILPWLSHVLQDGTSAYQAQWLREPR